MRFLSFVFTLSFALPLLAQNNFKIGYQEFPTTPSGHASDLEGNMYYTGQFKGQLTVKGSVLAQGEGLEDLFWVKTSPTGDVLHYQTFSSPNSDYAIADGLAMGSYGRMYFLSWSTDDIRFGNTVVPAYQYPNGGKFVSTISSIDTSGALQWIRRTNLNLRKVVSTGRLVHVIGAIYPGPGTIEVEDSTVFTLTETSGLLHMIFDTSGKFLGQKSIGATTGSHIFTLQQVHCYDEGSLLFSFQLQGNDGFTVDKYRVTLPAAFGQYHVLLRTRDTAYTGFQTKILNPNLNQVYGGNTGTLTSAFGPDGVFYAVLSPQAGPACSIDGYPVPFNQNTLVYFNNQLNVFRTATLGPSLVAPYAKSSVRRRIYFRSMGVIGKNLYLTGQYVGINEKPMNIITPRDTTVPIIGDLHSTVDLNGPSKSFVARTSLTSDDSKLAWIGEHTPYEHANLYPSLLHTVNNNRFVFLLNRDNVWNPWVVDTSLQVLSGEMKQNVDRPDIPQLVCFYPDGSKLVLSYASGKTAVDNAAPVASTSARRDLHLACFQPNGTLKWQNRIESTLNQPTARKLVMKNNKAWFLASYIGSQNDSNFIKVSSQAYDVEVNASLLCNIDANGKITAVNLPNAVYRHGIIQDFSFFQNGDVALLVNSHIPLTVPGFTNRSGIYLFRVNPATGEVIDTRQYAGPGYHSANSLVIDEDDMLYISSHVTAEVMPATTLSLYSASSELDAIGLTNNSDNKQHISLLKMSWNKFEWVKRFYGDAGATSAGYNDLFLVNNHTLLYVKTVTNNQPLLWENSLVHQGAYAGQPTLVDLDADGNLVRSRHLPLSITNFLRKGENEQLYVSGALYSTATIDTIQIGNAGQVDGVALVLDSSLVAKRMFRIASPFTEYMYDMDIYRDSVAVFAYSAQTTPAVYTYRTTAQVKDYDPTAFVTTVLLKSAVTLPVKLLDFTARLQGNDGALAWNVATQEGLLAYEIQRSIDAQVFEKVGNVRATNRTGTAHHSYTDRNIFSQGKPVVYYRLKMINKDGTFTLSQVAAVNISSSQTMVNLYPNPVRESAKLSIASMKSEKLRYQILDAGGKVVAQKTIAVTRGLSILPIDTRALSSGMYTLELKGEQTNQKIRFIKQ